MKVKLKKPGILPVLAVVAAVLLLVVLLLEKPSPEEPLQVTEQTTAPSVPVGEYTSPEDAEEKLALFAQMHDLTLDAWPERMVELLRKNPDAESFVLNYPFLKDSGQDADLSKLAGTGEVPRLYQWDARWGYTQYGDKEMALTGCGPTCLSMVCLYYLGDGKYTPRYVADFAEEMGYYTIGAGTEWALMSKGAKKLGLNVVTIPPNAKRIKANLEVGNLVVLAMEPGDFTESGHYILLTGVQDGKAIVHDPNSKINSEKLWKISSIRDQIENVWVFQPLEETEAGD